MPLLGPKKYIIYKKKVNKIQDGGNFINSEVLENLISTESPISPTIINKNINDVFNNKKLNDNYKKINDY